jgi:hypothetical protein
VGAVAESLEHGSSPWLVDGFILPPSKSPPIEIGGDLLNY